MQGFSKGLSDHAGFADVGVGEALQGAAEEVGASPAALHAQQASSHVGLGGGDLCIAMGNKSRK